MRSRSARSSKGRRQKAEGRRQKAEGRRQKAEGRRQKAKVWNELTLANSLKLERWPTPERSLLLPSAFCLHLIAALSLATRSMYPGSFDSTFTIPPRVG